MVKYWLVKEGYRLATLTYRFDLVCFLKQQIPWHATGFVLHPGDAKAS
jgi:hypothetical protein